MSLPATLNLVTFLIGTEYGHPADALHRFGQLLAASIELHCFFFG
jgi:hypothetical protein